MKISEENDDQTMLRQGVLTKLPDLSFTHEFPAPSAFSVTRFSRD